MSELYIITAPCNSGKTTTALKVAKLFGSRLDGFVTVSHDGKENLMLKRISTGEERLLMSRTRDLGVTGVIGYSFNEDTFRWAEEVLASLDSEWMMIDEVGRLDASGRGFAAALDRLMEKGRKVIICTRDRFVPMVTERFFPEGAHILEAGDDAISWAERMTEDLK